MSDDLTARAREIAAGLCPSERAALTWLVEHPECDFVPLLSSYLDVQRLTRAGLLVRPQHGRQATDLGRAVAAVLASEVEP